MEEVVEVILGIILIVMIVWIVSYTAIAVFYPGKKREILIVKKRTTVHTGYSNTFFKNYSLNHYTVDCRYAGSDRLRTLNCEQDVFNRLREGRSCTVTIKLMQIKKLHVKGAFE